MKPTILNPKQQIKNTIVFAKAPHYNTIKEYQLLTNFKEELETEKDFYVAFAKPVNENYFTTLSGYIDDEIEIDGSDLDGFAGNYLGEEKIKKLEKRFGLRAE